MKLFLLSGALYEAVFVVVIVDVVGCFNLETLYEAVIWSLECYFNVCRSAG